MSVGELGPGNGVVNQAGVFNISSGGSFNYDGYTYQGIISYNGSTLSYRPKERFYGDLDENTDSFRVIIEDERGGTVMRQITINRIDPNNPPPQIAITSSNDTASYTAPVSVEVTASASDTNGVSNVTFTLSGASSETISDNSAPYSATFTGLAAGNYSVEALATDNTGLVSSANIGFTVSPASGGNPTPGPTGSWNETGGTVADAEFAAVVPEDTDFYGVMAGSAGVNGGSASYNVPVIMAPGRNGMQPSVSLSYSSSSGNGIAGLGWSLNATSKIHRCGATIEQDGFMSDVQYDATRDRLCLDGQRLVNVSGTYGATDAVYRTELDSFVRVTTSGTINASATTFTVLTKDGRTNTYGITDNAKQNAQGRSEILAWALSKSADISGNTIEYTYNDEGSGEYTLKDITYTGFGTVSGDRKVEFKYENRIDDGGVTDYSTSYLAGGKSRQTKRLLAITSYYKAQIVRNYKLDYGAVSLSSARTLLRSIQECAHDGTSETCKSATSFEWQEASPRYALEPINFVDGTNTPQAVTNTPYVNTMIPRGDYNGDGTKDWPAIDTNADGVPDIAGHHANAEGEHKGTHTESLGYCYKPLNSTSRTCLSADFNQDGRTDAFTQSGGWGSNGVFKIKYAGDTQWTNTEITIDTYVDEPLAIADFNADGWPDIVFREAFPSNSQPPKLMLFLHTQDVDSPYEQTNSEEILEFSTVNQSGTNFFQDVQVLGDMDGNGTPDFLVSLNAQNIPRLPLPYKIIFTHSQANSELTTSEYMFTGFLDVSAATTPVGEANFFHDVNGDGLADWMAVNADQELSVKINHGGSFASSWIDLNVAIPMREIGYFADPTEPEWLYLPIMSRTFSMDYDGDGKQELLFSDSIVASACSEVTHWKNQALVTEWFCDDQLWNLVQGRFDSDRLTAVEGDIRDVSARSYKAIYFDENASGTLSASTADTDIVASATEKMAVDVTGDGLGDVVTTFECKIGSCRWNDQTSPNAGAVQNTDIVNEAYINRNLGAWTGDAKDAGGRYNYAAIDVMAKVTNGLGAESRWTYKPLSSDQYTDYNGNGFDFYTPDHGYLNGGDISATNLDHFHFASSMNVVAEYQASNGVGGLNSTLYRYGGATYNSKGRGFMGFRSIIVDDQANGVKNRTDFHQMWPKAGSVEKVCSWLSAEDEQTTNCSTAISETDISYVTKSTTTKTQWVAPDVQTKVTRDLAIRTTELMTETSDSNYDNYGNPTLVTSKVEDSYGTRETVVTNSWTSTTANWWLNRLDSQTTQYKKVVRKAADALKTVADTIDTTRTVSVAYASYNAHRKAESVTTSASDSARTLVVTSDFNTYGLPDWVQQTGQVHNGGSWSTQNRRTSFTYSKTGVAASTGGYFPYTVTNALSQVITTTTDPETGNSLTVTDANSVTATNTYDEFGRGLTTSSPGQPTQYMSYQLADNNAPTLASWQIVIQQAGTPDSIQYVDLLGRTIRTAAEDFAGAGFYYTDVSYNERGLMSFESVPYASGGTAYGTSYSGYDALGRLTAKSMDQTVGDLSTTYSYTGLVTTIEAGTLPTMTRTYNGSQQLVHTKDAKAGETRYAYDGMGNPIVIRDANNNDIKATYNGLGHKLTVTDPNMGLSQFKNNSFGEIEEEQDANNDIIDYQFDALGRITRRATNHSVTAIPDSTATFSWDAAETGCKIGLPCKEAENGMEKQYQYDSALRVDKVTTTIDTLPYVTEHLYDSQYGRLKGLVYPNELTVEYLYNAQGYLTTERNAGTSKYVYRTITALDAFGNIRTASLTNGNLTGSYTYYAATGQMMSSNVGGNTVHRLSYSTYDVYGNIKDQSNIATNTSEVFVYDDLQRLTNNVTKLGTTTVQDIDYDYDALGNFKFKGDYSTTSATAYLYGNGARDAGGNAGPNAVRQVTKPGGTVNFAYDNKGNMLSGDGLTATYTAYLKPRTLTRNGVTSTFEYGSDRARYKQTEGTKTTLYISPVYEKEGNNWRAYIGDIAVIKHNAASGSDPASTSIRFLHRDRLGSAVTLTDETGTVTERRRFDPFGKPRGIDSESLAGAALSSFGTEVDITDRGFTGHEHLDSQELIHMNGRVYDYNLGRFLSVDPFIQSPGNSQSINPYSYIMNNPLAGTDPTGYTSNCEGTTNGVCAEPQKQAEVTVEERISGSRLTRKHKVTVSTAVNGSTATVNVASDSGYANRVVAGAVKSALISNSKASQINSAESIATTPTQADSGGGNKVVETIKGVVKAGASSLKKGGGLGLLIAPTMMGNGERKFTDEELREIESRSLEIENIRSATMAKAIEDGFVTLFRTVVAGELADIASTGIFRLGKNSIEGKQFAITPEGAKYFRDKVIARLMPSGSPLTIVSARVSFRMFASLSIMKLDFSPAVHVYPNELPAFNRDMLQHGGISIGPTIISSK